MNYFTDPVLRGPTIGSMLMCAATALIGCIVFLRKQSLIGEVLSHSAYPGLILGVMFAGLLGLSGEEVELTLTALILIGAFSTALLGLWCIHFLETKVNVRSDSALCFVLSSFFGIGLTWASRVQFTHTDFYRTAQAYLYGQAATMTDLHVFIYGGLVFLIGASILLMLKELEIISFNREYALTLGIPVHRIDLATYFLTAAAVVIGIRSVGVVLISAMLIAPPAAARQYTNRLPLFLLLSTVFGVVSGYLGIYFSQELTVYLAGQYSQSRLVLPSGPMIVLAAVSLCFFSLLFAPKRGLCMRVSRMLLFRYQCLKENLLKALWRLGPKVIVHPEKINHHASLIAAKIALTHLRYNGWVEKVKSQGYRLTPDGIHKAARIVRLHRLWEVYLVDYLGVGAERVHRSAEEMEHIITPDLEAELSVLLKDPVEDPHHQKIPPHQFL